MGESWALNHSDLKIQGHLGTGQFGDVVLAFLKSTTCTSRVKSHVDRMVAQGNTLASSKAVAVKFLKGSSAISCILCALLAVTNFMHIIGSLNMVFI